MIFNHHTVKDVGFADKLGSEAAVGIVVHVAGRADLLQPTVGHTAMRVAIVIAFLVVRNHNAGYADLFQRIDQLELGLLAQFLIQRPKVRQATGFSDVLPNCAPRRYVAADHRTIGAVCVWQIWSSEPDAAFLRRAHRFRL